MENNLESQIDELIRKQINEMVVKEDAATCAFNEMNFQPLTRETLEKAIWRIGNADKINSIALGFTGNGVADDQTVLMVSRDTCTQGGKTIFLVTPGGKVHKKLLELENSYDFKLERLDENSIKKLIYMGITDEQGNEIPLPPPEIDVSPDFNPFNYLG